MANSFILISKPIKPTICLLFLAILLGCANSARLLDQVPSNPFSTSVGGVTSQSGPSTLPSGQFPAAVPATTTEDDVADSPLPIVDDAATPIADEEPIVAPVEPDTVSAPIAGPNTTTSPSGWAPNTTTSVTVTQSGPQALPLTFFMHDILGGSHPSARVVTGIIANSGDNGIPFSKANNNFFPLQGGVPVPLINGNINNNNIPFLAGFNGAQSNTVLQNTGNNNIVNGGNNQPFVTAGQLPSGATLQQLMFGSLTVIDDELTEGQELGSGVIGRAQGFYLASSLDGTSQTLALTVLLHGGEHDHGAVEDTISLFGVHRTASPDSQVAVVGGTGKYENAKGYATVETLHHQEDQHTTDGVDTIVHFSVYLSE